MARRCSGIATQDSYAMWLEVLSYAGTSADEASASASPRRSRATSSPNAAHSSVNNKKTANNSTMAMEAIRCTLPSCRCDCFSPGKTHIRTCDSCNHDWVTHALDKLGAKSSYQLGMHVEVVQPNIVFDIASLMLYGAQAAPIRLKILLDRLFSVLQHDEVLQVLHSFGWSYEDYARGYILQETGGRVLDKWALTTRDEEQLIISQFLRFGETKSIAQEIILQDARDARDRGALAVPRSESEIKKFLERSNGSQSYLKPGFEQRHFIPRPGGVPQLSSSGGRMISPPGIPQSFSPISSRSESPRRSDSSMILPVTMSSPSPRKTDSPMSHLRTMQPFDYRRRQCSPPPSPTGSEHSLPTTPSSRMSPQNLSIGMATTPIMSHKSESSDEKLTPTSTGTAATSTSIESAEAMKEELQCLSPEGAINYSIKEGGESPQSLYSDQKLKHLRKSSNPIKRPWTPTPGYGGTLISPSGKKRVLCTACNKTFCDKGALKIHYSAVHLKEMHKCSVEGCNMMFSSRRSRNRHSANPNPKLHMPQARRKLPDSPPIDEKRLGSMPGLVPPPNVTCQPELAIPSLPAALGLIHTKSLMHGKPPIDMISSSAMSFDRPSVVTVPADPGYFIDTCGQVRHRLHDRPIMSMSPPAKMARMEEDEQNERELEEMERKHEAEQEEEKAQAPSRSRRRKGFVPTRYPAAASKQAEEVYAMSDDNSNDGISFRMDDECLAGNGCASPKEDDERLEGIDKEETNGSEGSPLAYPIEDDELHIDESDCDDARDSDENEIPFDKDNPKKCPACDKVFQNHFMMKSHYQNVHLKLMHTCRVDGCNAAFPSKRSRDRHSSNLNLHRKLLSTSMSGDLNEEKMASSSALMTQSLRDEFLPRIYESHHFSNMYSDHRDNNAHEGDDNPGDADTEDTPHPDPDGAVACHICQQSFRDNLVLKEHLEKIHPKEMYKCTINGCDKIFSTRKSRNRHSQNDNLHRHLVKVNASA